MEDEFSKRKNDVLSKLDKSFIGGWDEKIVELCKEINKSENYYTTSSCAGRVVLIIDQERKEAGLFVKVYHDLISFEELKEGLGEIVKIPPRSPGHPPLTSARKTRDIDKLVHPNLIRFKMESCILHVACRTLEDAQLLFDKAKLAGWKRSGIISSGNRVMLELNSTEKLEFPIVAGGEIIVDDKFLKIVVKSANEKLEKSWKKIEGLKSLVE